MNPNLPDPGTDATRLLHAIEGGDRLAAEQLLPLVYDELRKLAAHRLAGDPAGWTLQPTALVHEAWLRLVGDRQPTFEGRGISLRRRRRRCDAS